MLSCNRQCRALCVFPMRYDHHLAIKSKAITVTGSGGPCVFPVRYEYFLGIKSDVRSEAISVTVR
jgi:hypothetical protein